MNYHKQIAKIARFLGREMVVSSVKITKNNTIKIEVVIDGVPCGFHLAQCHNKYHFRELFLMRLAEIER